MEEVKLENCTVQQQQQQQQQSKKKSKNKKKSSRNETTTTDEDQLSQMGLVADINGLKDQLKQQLHIAGTPKVNGLVTDRGLNSNNCNNSTPAEPPTLNGHHKEGDDISLTTSKKSKRKPNNKKNPSSTDLVATTEPIKRENGDCHSKAACHHADGGEDENEHLQNGNVPAPATNVTSVNVTTCNNTAMTNPKAQISEQTKTSANDDKNSSSAIADTTASPTSATPSAVLDPVPALDLSNVHIEYKEYESELQMHDIMRLIQAELSEPYSIYTYRYFIYNWPKLCFLAAHGNEYVGAIVCKLDMHMNVRRGYIAMLAVRKEYRKLKIGTTLVQKAIEAMLADNADEVVLETEMSNLPALRLYENLGFVRDKRLFRYYLNGVDALRLKLWFR
ncbi:N-alpha-acetyltransferase 30A [Musca domestica]|uniref:N-alpha-acetyltransferase 30A n=1 Tax=Musca domestica TaxID=7370 RepID=A0ABM3UV66_MUSDO|nr:N-alpha-acetyltransferase 30A [Musca domestica]